MNPTPSLHQQIRDLLGHATTLAVPLSELDDSADLYAAGMSSLEVVTLIVSLERQIGNRFDPDMLDRDTFASIAAIGVAVEKLRARG